MGAVALPKMEEIGATFPEYQPLQVLQCSFVRPCPTNHPSHPYSLVTGESVPSFNVESVI